MKQHTFGGSALDRYIYEYEVPDDGGDGGDVPPDEPPAEEVWAGPSQEEWQQTQAALTHIVQSMQQPADAGPAVDPFADDFQARLDAYLDQKIAPLAQSEEQRALEAAEAQAGEILQGFAADDPFLIEGSLAKARTLANEFLPRTQQQYGFGPKAATEALKLAHKAVREWEDQVGKAYYERELAQLQGLGSVRREPQPSGDGAAQQLIVASGPGDEHAVLAKYFHNNGS